MDTDSIFSISAAKQNRIRPLEKPDLSFFQYQIQKTPLFFTRKANAWLSKLIGKACCAIINKIKIYHYVLFFHYDIFFYTV